MGCAPQSRGLRFTAAVHLCGEVTALLRQSAGLANEEQTKGRLWRQKAFCLDWPGQSRL